MDPEYNLMLIAKKMLKEESGIIRRKRIKPRRREARIPMDLEEVDNFVSRGSTAAGNAENTILFFGLVYSTIEIIVL
jgi:hypothetical protein